VEDEAQVGAAHALPRSAVADGQTLALILGGNDGSVLERLADSFSLPFAADHRVIDFPIGNCLASGVRRIALLTCAKPHSLVTYVQQCSTGIVAEAGGGAIEIWPAQRHRSRATFSPAVDLLLQNADLIAELAPKRVLVLSGTQIYRADYRPLLEAHARAGYGATIGCIALPAVAARGCDVATVDGRGRLLRLESGQRHAEPGGVSPALVPIGAYVFDRDLLLDCLAVDEADQGSTHDLAHDLLPLLIRASGVHAHELAAADAAGYWRAVDTVDGYWCANMELLRDGPKADLSSAPFAGRVRPAPHVTGAGVAVRSIIAGGCKIEGSVQDSVLSSDCSVQRAAHIASSVLLPGARIGRRSRISRAIIGPGCVLPEGTVIGEDLRADAERFTVSPGGVVVVGADHAAQRPSLRLA
jgi:glucose-1-phosphate adenylyltransferase